MFSEVISLIKLFVVCGTVFFITFTVLMALPQCKLRSVCLEIFSWLLAGCLALLVLSPVDVVPDVLPVVGWIDDLGYAAGSFMAVMSAIKQNHERKHLPF